MELHVLLGTRLHSVERNIAGTFWYAVHGQPVAGSLVLSHGMSLPAVYFSAKNSVAGSLKLQSTVPLLLGRFATTENETI